MARILFITPRFPWPLIKGDQLRAFHQIKYLSISNEIVLFAITREKIKPEWINELKPFCVTINIFQLSYLDIGLAGLINLTSRLPFQSIYHYNSNALAAIQKIYKDFDPHHLIFQLIRMAPYAAFFPVQKCVIDLMDCFSYHYLLRAKHSGVSKSWFYKIEYVRVKAYEHQIISQYQKITVISEKDRQLLPGKIEKIYIIRNGVDIPYAINVDKNVDILFLGNLSYEPNIAAAVYIVEKILPLIPAGLQAQILIAGRSPSKKVLKLERERVKILANIETITPVISTARMFIAPMFLSTGVQNKILEAMAAGLIVITSPNAADAIGAFSNREILTAVSPMEFVEHIVDVITNPHKYVSLAENAQRFVVSNYNWKTNVEKLEVILNK